MNGKKFTHEIGLDLINVTNQLNILGLTHSPSYNDPKDYYQEQYQLGFLPLFYYQIDF